VHLVKRSITVSVDSSSKPISSTSSASRRARAMSTGSKAQASPSALGPQQAKLHQRSTWTVVSGHARAEQSSSVVM